MLRVQRFKGSKVQVMLRDDFCCSDLQSKDLN